MTLLEHLCCPAGPHRMTTGRPIPYAKQFSYRFHSKNINYWLWVIGYRLWVIGYRMGYGWFEAVFGLWFSSTVEQPWPITLNYELLTTITPSITHNLSTMNYQLRGDIACILALKSGHPCLRTEGHESMSMGFLTSASGRRPVPCPPKNTQEGRPIAPALILSLCRISVFLEVHWIHLLAFFHFHLSAYLVYDGVGQVVYLGIVPLYHEHHEVTAALHDSVAFRIGLLPFV